MPEIVYTVKVVLDPSSEKIVGKAIDEGLEKGVKDAAAAIEKATGKQVTFNKVLEDGNKQIKETNNLLKANITNVQSANAQARNYDNTLKRLITDEKTDVATLKEKAEQHKRFIPVLEESVAEMRAYGAATEMSKEESTKYNNTLARAEQTLRTMMSTNINLSNSLKQHAGEMGDATGQAGRFNKTMSGANQTIFAFSDLVQDSTQFMIGGRFNFATGMRAIGNNVGFAAELFGNLQQNVQRYNQAIADGTIKNGQQTTTLQALSKSFTGAGGIILGVNFAVTAITLLSNAFARNRKEAEETTNALSDLSDEILSFADTNDLNTRSLLSSISRQNELATSFERYSRTLSKGGFHDLATVYYEQAQALREESKVQQERADELLRILQIQSGLSEQTIKNRLANLDLNESRIEGLEIEEKKLELFLQQDGAIGVLSGGLDELLKVQRGIIKIERANLRSKLAVGLITQQEFDNQSAILDQKMLQLKIEEDIAKARAQQEIFGETDADRVVEDFQKTAFRMIDGEITKIQLPIELEIFGEDDVLRIEENERKAQEQEMKDIDERRLKDLKEFQDRATDVFKSGEEARLNIKKSMQSAFISLAQVLAEKNKGIAIGLLAVQKGLAISEVIINAQKSIAAAKVVAGEYLATGNIFMAGVARAQVPLIKASAAASIAAIAAQGINQGKQLGGGGGGGTGGGTAYTQPERQRGFFETDYREPSIDAFSPARPESVGATIVLQGSLDEEVMAYKVKSGNAKIESGTTYLGD
jgi:hypothetical protein